MDSSDPTLRAQLKLDLLAVAAHLDRDEVEGHHGEIVAVLQRLEDLGVTDLMAPSEVARSSIDNLPTMLEDRAGITALRDTMALAARLIDTMSGTAIRDWWGGTEPEVLVAGDARSPGIELFYVFGGRLIEHLANQWNLLAVPAPDVDTVDPDALWPPVYCVVTNHPGFRDWTWSWGGQLIWWVDTENGFSVEKQSPIGSEALENFTADQVAESVTLVAEWIAESPRAGSSSGINVNEHRALEVVVRAAQNALERPELSMEDRLQIEILTSTLLLQLRAPKPDRTIIGRALHGVSAFAGGVLTGVAATYLTSLMIKFGLPPP